jgi:hypothetical protein
MVFFGTNFHQFVKNIFAKKIFCHKFPLLKKKTQNLQPKNLIFKSPKITTIACLQNKEMLQFDFHIFYIIAKFG